MITNILKPAAHTVTVRALALASVVALSALACPAPARAGARLASFDPRIGATLLGRTDAARQITLALHLPPRDPAGIADFIAHVTKRGDPLYRKYLTPAGYAARFGASQADYDAVLAWANSSGLTVGEHYAARTVLTVTGPASKVETAFGTTFSDYRDARGHVFYAASGSAQLPDAIAGKIRGVIGLQSSTHFASFARSLPLGVKPLGFGHGIGGGFSAADLRSLYSIPVQTFGPPQTLAVFEQGGFDQSDITTYVTSNKLPMVPVTVRPVDGYDGGIDDAGIEKEAVIDIDMQIALNPAAQQILVYEDGMQPFQVALLDSLSAMASDNSAKSISISYGTDEVLQGQDAIDAENTVLEQMTAQGQAVFASAGDQGAYGRSGSGLNVADPASQPFVTGVGGTTVFPGPKETYNAEETWNDLGAGHGATGGGISNVWPIPGWQTPGGYTDVALNGGSLTMRNVPDVASVANPLTGVSIYSGINGGWLTAGGTSVSAPIWSGFYSLVIAASQGFNFGMPGFANPSIFGIGVFQGLVENPFNDVTDGSNGNIADYGIAGFNAGPLYDNTTGWGSFIGDELLVDMVAGPSDGSTPPPAPANVRGVASSTRMTLRWTGAKSDNGYVVLVSPSGEAYLATAVLATAHKATIGHLKPNTQYYVAVYAVSHGGETSATPVYVTTSAGPGE
jgi:subtilase family serine protease